MELSLGIKETRKTKEEKERLDELKVEEEKGKSKAVEEVKSLSVKDLDEPSDAETNYLDDSQCVSPCGWA